MWVDNDMGRKLVEPWVEHLDGRRLRRTHLDPIVVL